MSRRYKIDLVLLFVVLIVGVVSLKNAVAIGDWWYFRHYDPPANIAKLATDAGMNETGRRLFYRFDPQVVDSDTMRRYCGAKLGCVTGDHLYILQSNDQSRYDRSIVTAAHEMLHVAYSRLHGSNKSDVDKMVDTEIATGPGQSVAFELQGYAQSERTNEAHSYLGSEAPKLSSGLEQYYRRYFDDRSKTTAAYSLSPEGEGRGQL